MTVQRFLLVIPALVIAATVNVLPAQQTVVAVDGDDITIQGCIQPANIHAAAPSGILVWSRSDIMLAAATATGAALQGAVGTAGMQGRIFYWLDDDDDLARHVGQMVEVKGDLKDFETGKVKIDRDDEVTEIEVDLDGRKEKARIPTAWLRGTGPDHDTEYKIVTRRVDVDDVRVLGACVR
jgi:hypothetical protein